MNNAMEETKNKVEKYKILLSKKEEIENKFNTWNELYNECQKLIAELEELYETTKDPKYLEELEKYIEENKDYLAMVLEQSKRLEEISEELDGLQVTEEQIEASKKLEYENTKGNEPTTSGSDSSANNNDDSTALNIDNNTNDNELTAASVSKSENNDTRKSEIEAEMQKLQVEMDFYKNARGSKCRFKCLEEHIVTPIEYREPYKIAAGKYRKFQKELESLNNLESSTNNNTTTGGEDLIEETNVDKLIRLYRENYVADEYENVYSDSSKYKDLGLSVPDNDDYDIADDPQIQQAIDIVNKHHDDYIAKTKAEATKKPKGFMKILSVKKPVNKEKLKDSIKRATIGIAAMAVVVGSTYLPGLFNKNDNGKVKDLKGDITTSQVGNLSEDEKDDYSVMTPEIDEVISSTDTTNVEETEFIRLGDKFSVEEASKIYDTMYDATLNRNAQHRYFSAEYERTIGGLAINYEGELYFFYSNDDKAQENVDMLLANGGKITAVLGENASGYEGFYSIDDVVTLNNTLGGVNR